jgi:hypothetical protein
MGDQNSAYGRGSGRTRDLAMFNLDADERDEPAPLHSITSSVKTDFLGDLAVLNAQDRAAGELSPTL